MQSRRQFLTTAGTSVAAAGLAGIVPRPAPAAGYKGHIIRITADDLVSRDRPVVEVASRMLDLGIREFSGKSKGADGWASLFSPKDLVAIKINCLGKPKMSTTPEVVQAIIIGLRSAGVPEERIVVFDLYGSHMRMSRYRLHNGSKGVRYVHNSQWGYEDKWRELPRGKTRFTNILLQADKVISVPVLKDHDLSGVTCALKNMAFGAIENPSAHHRDNCNPGIANIYNLDPCKSKVTLIICDGAFIQYEGGPQSNPAARLPFNSLLLTTDPVAMDKMAWEYLDELRKQKGKRPLHKGRGKPVHIATAAGLGLGTDDRSKIKLVQKKA